MFNELRIANFRGITELEIQDLRPVTLLVGKNNCGKTTVLEGFFVMINPSNLDLFGRTNAGRGFPQVTDRFWRVLFKDQDLSRTIRLEAVLENPQEQRQLSIKPRISPITGPGSNDSQKETRISAHDASSESADIVKGLEGVSHFSCGKEKKQFNVSVFVQDSQDALGRLVPSVKIETPKDYTEPRRGAFLNPMSILTGIAEQFDRLQVAKKKERVIKVLREIEPRLIDIVLGAGNLLNCDIGSEWLLPLDVMGGGMKNVLAIMLAMHNAQGGTLLVDEIENGLHPVSQQILWRAVFEGSREFNTQVIAATHSMECVRAFFDCYNPSLTEKDQIRLYRIEKDKDRFTAFKFDSETLRTSLENGWEIR